MAYRFKLDENTSADFRRIGLEQINRARLMLEDVGDPALAVHGARKSIKRVRALLRLARPGLGEKAFAVEDAGLRGIARRLADARDRHVLVETAKRLERRGGQRAKAAFAAVNAILPAPDRTALNGAATGAVAAIGELRDVMKRFKRLAIEPDAFAVLARGLEKSYRRGRRAFASAYERPDDETFHDWRKSVQQHWRQMALLSRAWPDYMAARACEARELSQCLGEDHDLAMLGMMVNGRLDPAPARIIERLVRERQAAVRAAARSRGLRLFAESPARLRQRVELYWSLARRMAGHEGLNFPRGKDSEADALKDLA